MSNRGHLLTGRFDSCDIRIFDPFLKEKGLIKFFDILGIKEKTI